jgi:hypothetical protein
MEGTPQKGQLGCTLLDRPVELNYSTSSQWIQANDGVRDPHNRDLGWPWGSIEGGHLVSHGLGGAPSRVVPAPTARRVLRLFGSGTSTARDRGSPENRAHAQAHAPFSGTLRPLPPSFSCGFQFWGSPN